jgi:hypothetical protein
MIQHCSGRIRSPNINMAPGKSLDLLGHAHAHLIVAVRASQADQ